MSSLLWFFLKEVLVFWSLAMDERGGHEDLCGSGRYSVIHYVHRIMKVYFSKPDFPVPYLFSDHCEVTSD
jgi:hypothetical protein